MKKLAIILTLTIGLLSCENKKAKHTDKPLTENQQTTKDEMLELDFNEPVLIDSSFYVMYPLTLKNNDVDDYGNISSNARSSYWNIIFYNTANGKYHLLSDSIKMVINSFTQREDDIEYLDSGLLFYSITTNDYNGDGNLNAEDPNYLFITNKEGKDFKQISPDNANVTSWQKIKGTNKILLMATQDTNGDKKFNEYDEWVPLVYDLTKSKVSTDIFDDGYKTRLKKLLNNQWTKLK